MYRWLAENLGNVSVKRKLGIGFGLVLLLTLLITFTGWTGMSGIISRGDKLGFISSLNELTKDLRLARLDYEARRGEQGPGAVNELLTKLDSGLQTARGLIEQPADAARVDQQLAAVAEYKRAFAEMVQAGPTVKTPAANSAPPPTTPWPRSPKWKNQCSRATALRSSTR